MLCVIWFVTSLSFLWHSFFSRTSPAAYVEKVGVWKRGN